MRSELDPPWSTPGPKRQYIANGIPRLKATDNDQNPSEIREYPYGEASDDEEAFETNIQDFIGYVKVTASWSNDPPEGFVKEITGGSPDLNDGYGGDYVWLRVVKPYHVFNPKPLIKGFHLAIRDRRDPHAIDLSTGENDTGLYRLLYVDRAEKGMCVDSLRLWRSKTPQSKPPGEWGATGMTTNINEGRNGSYLYLVWHSRWYNGYDKGDNGVDELKTWGE